MRSNFNKLPLLCILSLLTFVGCVKNNNSSSDNGSSNSSDNQSNNIHLDEIIDYVDNKVESGDQFDYQGNYIAPELIIDGELKDPQWAQASEELVFGETKNAKMKIYRGNDALFCFFTVEDIDIETIGNNNGDDVTKGDSVEVYFDFKNDASNKPNSDDIQINIGAHGKTRIFVGSNGQWGSWNGLLDYSILINGTLNNNKDVDVGYTVELMIPYSQVGIDKNSIFGVTCGHVQRGLDSVNDTLPYTWGGLIVDNNFVDPQSPKAYLLSMGNNFYSKGKEPIGNIKVSGKVVDLDNKPLENAKIKIGGKETTTGTDGRYYISDLDSLLVSNIEISKDGYQLLNKEIVYSSLKSDSGEVKFNYCLLKNNEAKEINLTGTVKNPVYGEMNEVMVSSKTENVITNDKGEFSINVIPSYDLTLTLEKDGFKNSVNEIDINSLVGKSEIDLGVLSLYSPSSSTQFGGERGTQLVNAEIYRGFDGIHFLFKTEHSIINGDKIELFIDTEHSFHGRDKTDYRIDFDSDGNIFIENYGNGTNNIPSASGIKNKTHLNGTTYYMEVMVPYTFLGILSGDVIGVSFGIYDSKILEWNGWGFAASGFEDYVAPEYSDQYVRIGADNLLYRTLNNTDVVRRVSGKILDSNNNPIASATVNGKFVNSDGSFLLLATQDNFEITIEASGFKSITKIIATNEFVDGVYSNNFVLTKVEAVVKGTCNVNGTKVYLQSDPNVFTFVENGKYEIIVPTTSNAKLVFQKDGYQEKIVSIGKLSLVQSAEENTYVEKNIVLEVI